MKKYFVVFIVFSILGLFQIQAQDHTQSVKAADSNQSGVATAPSTVNSAKETDLLAAPEAEEQKSFHQVLREKFIEGSPAWMAPILICMIIGLGLAIERIIYLNMSTTNSKKLLLDVEQALSKGGVEEAKEVCRSTRGPLAGIFFEGLDRYEGGMEMVEKSIVSYGSVLNGKLESNLTWIALFIALSPMLGFLGTVVGMVQAFDAIEAAGDISPAIVAGGIKVALLTTVFGLIVAMILQVLYNYIVAKIDRIVNTMEDATISFVDVLLKFQKKSQQ